MTFATLKSLRMELSGLFRSICARIGYLLTLGYFGVATITGRQFLNLLLVTELIGFCFIVTISTIHVTAYLMGNWITKDFGIQIIRVLNPILATSNSLLRIFLLWIGLKEPTKRKRYIRLYLRTKYIFLLVLGLLTYARRDIFPRKRWELRNYISVIVMIALTMVIIWAMWGVQYYMKKLDSPHQMIEFRQFIEAMKATQRCSGVAELSAESCNIANSNDKKDSSEKLEMKKTNMRWEDLERHILSPLDIAIDDKSPLANGTFGVVHQGLLVKNGTEFDIVIKSSKTFENSANFSMILQELKILIHVGNHTNIVKFFGIISHADLKADSFGIVNELCNYKSLLHFLTNHKYCFKFKDKIPDISMTKSSATETCTVTLGCNSTENKRCALNIEDLFRFALQICCGMEHLSSKKVVHGDLAARNVLLTENLTAKITDFGMSRRLYNYQLYSHLDNPETLLPWKWMSIEALEDLKFSEKSDVWAFGVTLWELFTIGKSPYDGMTWMSGFAQLLRTGVRLPQPTFANSDVFDAMETCWQLLCEQRPNFSELKSILESSFQKIKLNEKFIAQRM